MRRRVVIVGASLAGVTVAEQLRDRGCDDAIWLVGAEDELPYDRPPLSKEYLHPPTDAGRQEPSELLPEQWYADNSVSLRLGTSVVGLDPGAAAVVLASGERLSADHVVIATGARARELAGWEPRCGVYYLRTLADAERLRDRLRRRGRLVVVGGGFVGLEVAAAARRSDWQVVVLERAPYPLVRVLGRSVGELCTALHQRNGVEVRCDVTVDGLVGMGPTGGVQLADGTVEPADAVVVGTGSVPNSGLVNGPALTSDGAIRCDEWGRTNVPNVWAAGDVAAWPNPFLGGRQRVEQWQSAREQGRVVAEAIAGISSPGWRNPPYFWSDQYEAKVQFVGRYHPQAETHVVRTGARALAVIGRTELEGVLAVSAPRQIALGRKLLMRGLPFGDARRWARESMANAGVVAAERGTREETNGTRQDARQA